MLFPDLILILLLMLSADALWWRASDRRLRRVRLAPLWRSALALFMIMQMAYVLIALLLPRSIRQSRSPIPMMYHTQAYIWHMIVLPAVALVWGIAWVISGWKNRRRARFASPALIGATVSDPQDIQSQSTHRAHLSRRQLLAAAACAAPPLIATAVGGQATHQLGELRVRHFELHLPMLPLEFDGATITQVTDLHIGRFLHEDRLPQIIERANALESDFVVFTGDLIDLSLDDLPMGIDFLRKLRHRHGMAICEGNHDLVENRGEFERVLLNEGLPLLITGGLTLPFRGRKLQFLGIPWNGFDGGHEQAMRFLRPMIDPEAFPILLAHHPHAFDPAAKAGLPLTLSGHTHGGQIMFNERLGAGSIRFRYISGLYQKPNSMLVVCNGIGNWFPLRINAPAEIVHLTLRRSQLR